MDFMKIWIESKKNLMYNQWRVKIDQIMLLPFRAGLHISNAISLSSLISWQVNTNPKLLALHAISNLSLLILLLQLLCPSLKILLMYFKDFYSIITFKRKPKECSLHTRSQMWMNGWSKYQRLLKYSRKIYWYTW